MLALGIFLLGAVGIAVESALYYTHRQMAQAAADAAAQAAMTSIFGRTNTGANAMDGTLFTCDASGTDLRTPCHVARQHGFGRPGDNDIIDIGFPSSIPGVGDLSDDVDNPIAVEVIISRPFTTGLLQFIGVRAATISVRGVAAILIKESPVPILVMHPDEPESMKINGNPTIRICGGPLRSIQVNSVNTASFAVSGGGGGANFVDLSGAGPGGPPLACLGSGGEFGNHGGPFDFSAASNGYPGGTILPVDSYLKTLPIDDPLAIPMPFSAEPENTGLSGSTSIVVATGGGASDPNGCPLPPGEECVVYSPGEYAGGITIKGETALFEQGLYYIHGGGFHLEANGIVHMKRPCVPVAPFNCGVLIYNNPLNAADIIEVRANSGQIKGVSYSQDLSVAGSPDVSCTGNCFQGPAEVFPYFNVVFMNNRNYNLAPQEHLFQGGGGLTIAGTMYFTASFDANKSSLDGNPNYQTLILQGTPGSTTEVIGQILVDSLNLGGNAEISMTLNPNTKLPIRKLALIR